MIDGEENEKPHIKLKSSLTFTREEFEVVVEHFATLQKWQREEDVKLKVQKQTENGTLSNQFDSGVSTSESAEVKNFSN